MSHNDDCTILVSGGAGFIGSHLCEQLLAGGARVIALDSLITGRRENLRHLERESRFDFIEQDVIDAPPRQLLDAAGITHVYHLACAASPPQYQADPEHTMLTNVLGTRNMLRLAERHGARFLLSSTSEVYGDPEVHPQREDYLGAVNCTGPRACYDEGKRSAETLAFDFARQRRADVRVARIFNTYGPRMRRDDGRVVSNVICQALAGADITIYGDGSQTRSFCFVDDLIDGLMRLMHCEAAAGIPVNIGNPDELEVSELVDLVLAMTGSQSRVTYQELPVDDPRRRRPDIQRARDLLGWEPRVELKSGLVPTIASFQNEERAIGDSLAFAEPAIAAAE